MKLIAPEDMPPSEIIEAAEKLSAWFAQRNITEWKLAGCQSRTEAPLPAAPRSYHDVVVHVAGGRAYRIFDSAYGLRLTCTRAGGWELWNVWGGKEELLAGEYGSTRLSVVVDGIVICGESPLTTPGSSSSTGMP